MNKYTRSVPHAGNGTLRRKVTARLKAEGRACHICKLAIDPQATGAHAFNCDEVIPRAFGGSPYAYENLASAHACCNNWRRTKSIEQVATIRARAARVWSMEHTHGVCSTCERGRTRGQNRTKTATPCAIGDVVGGVFLWSVSGAPRAPEPKSPR